MIEQYALLKTSNDVKGVTFDPLGIVREYLHTVLTTSYFYTFSAFSVLFTAIAVLVTYAMDAFFPQVKNFTGFIYLLDTITFLPGFVYMGFLNQVLNGYTTSVRNYLDYLQILERIAMTCSVKTIKEVFPILLVLIDVGDNFRGDTRPLYFSVLMKQEPKRASNLRDHIKSMPVKIAIRHLISLLRKNDVGVGELFAKVQQLETGEMVKEPNFMYNQNMILLFSWYCIWVPITLWVQVGSTITFILFPFISYILWGTAIQRVWLGDAWDDSRPFKESEHIHWPSDFKESIKVICEERMVEEKKG